MARKQVQRHQGSPPSMTGPWSMAEVEQFLRSQVIPIRLSALSQRGWPLVVSLWYLYTEGLLVCASRPSARVIKLLEAEPRCGFEISRDAPPYLGVRGQGLAHLNPDSGAETLRSLADRYLGRQETAFRRWLLARADDEIAIEIRPVRLMSWDYRERMEPVR